MTDEDKVPELKKIRTMERVLEEYGVVFSDDDLEIFTGYLLFPLLRCDRVSYESIISTDMKIDVLAQELARLSRCVQYLRQNNIVYETEQPTGLEKTKRGIEMFEKLESI